MSIRNENCTTNSTLGTLKIFFSCKHLDIRLRNFPKLVLSKMKSRGFVSYYQKNQNIEIMKQSLTYIEARVRSTMNLIRVTGEKLEL